MDGAYAAVKFLNRDNDGASTSKDDGSTLLQDCRLLRKDELQVTVVLCVCVCVVFVCVRVCVVCVCMYVVCVCDMQTCMFVWWGGRGGSISEMVVVFISHAN